MVDLTKCTMYFQISSETSLSNLTKRIIYTPCNDPFKNCVHHSNKVYYDKTNYFFSSPGHVSFCHHLVSIICLYVVKL